MAKFLLMPFGSAGDVYPFIGLGRHLRQRGHHVALATNERFGPAVARAEIEFIQQGTNEQFEEAMSNPDLWHPRRGLDAVVGNRFMSDALQLQFDVIHERLAQSPDLVVGAGSLCLGARVAREVLPMKLVTVHLQPSVMLSVTDPPVFPGMSLPKWLPRWIVRGAYGIANRFVIDPPVRKVLEPFRKGLGLKPTRAYLQSWIHSPDLCLGLFPSWYGQGRDWPSNLKLTGFPLYDDRTDEPLPSDLEEFLNTGPVPIVITFGTGMAQGQQLFQLAVSASERLGLRAVILTPCAEQVPNPLPVGMKRFDYAPLSRLLPRAKALVFHGGIGTMAQGLAAGIPLVCIPLAHDQPDNANRLEKLGICKAVPAKSATVDRVVSALSYVTSSETVRKSCDDIARRFHDANALEHAVSLLEGLANN